MKKFLSLLVIAVLAVGLVACGGSGNSGETDVDKTETASDVYFKDGVLQLEDGKIEITDTKVVEAGAKGNEDSEKPVIVFYYTATNESEKELGASTIWIAAFDVHQDTDKDTVNELEIGSYSDENIDSDKANSDMKPGGSVKNMISYELDDMEIPVVLKATQGIGGKDLGEQTFNIKK